jgi:2-hydroxychromene-2-carboxylate isomerase
MAPNVSGGGTAESEAIKVEFFFDFSSPWTYLAFRRFRALMLDIQSLKPAMAVEFHLRPVLVGAVFNAVNPSVYEMRKAPGQDT